MNRVIIARFREDLSWISNIDRDLFKVTVYNKGESINADCIPLENVGREADTYLNFIIDNYYQIIDNERYFFLQGNPFDHGFSISHLNDHSKSKLNFMAFGRPYRENIGSKLGKNFPKGLPLNHFCEMIFSNLSFQNGDLISFNPGGQFSVKGSSILQRHINFYIFLREINRKLNPIEAHLLERLWPEIFDQKNIDRITCYENYKIDFLKNSIWGGNAVE